MAGGDEGENNGLPKVQERGKDECLEQATEPVAHLELHPRQTTSDTEEEDENERVPGYHEHKKVFVEKNQHQSTKLFETVEIRDIKSTQDVNDKVYDATKKISDALVEAPAHFPNKEQKTVSIPENVSIGRLTFEVPENIGDDVVETQSHVQNVGHKAVNIPCTVETPICAEPHVTDRMLVSYDTAEYFEDCAVGSSSYVQDIIQAYDIPGRSSAEYEGECIDDAPEKIEDDNVQTTVIAKDVVEKFYSAVEITRVSVDRETSVSAQEQTSQLCHETTNLESLSGENVEDKDGEVVIRILSKSLNVTKRATIGRQKLTWLAKPIRHNKKQNVKSWKQRLFRKKSGKEDESLSMHRPKASQDHTVNARIGLQKHGGMENGDSNEPRAGLESSQQPDANERKKLLLIQLRIEQENLSPVKNSTKNKLLRKSTAGRANKGKTKRDSCRRDDNVPPCYMLECKNEKLQAVSRYAGHRKSDIQDIAAPFIQRPYEKQAKLSKVKNNCLCTDKCRKLNVTKLGNETAVLIKPQQSQRGTLLVDKNGHGQGGKPDVQNEKVGRQLNLLTGLHEEEAGSTDAKVDCGQHRNTDIPTERALIKTHDRKHVSKCSVASADSKLLYETLRPGGNNGCCRTSSEIHLYFLTMLNFSLLFDVTKMVSIDLQQISRYIPAERMKRLILVRYQRFLKRKKYIKQYLLKRLQKKKVELMKSYFLLRHKLSGHFNRLFVKAQGKKKAMLKTAELLHREILSKLHRFQAKFFTGYSVIKRKKKASFTKVYCCKHCEWVENRCGFTSDVGIVTEYIVENPQALLFAPPQRNSNRRSRKYMRDVEADGQVSDSSKDPPGQQSYYIPPGDTRKENYRLATFEHFPIESPISRKSLAKCGFYFTGFLDRVKCFACGRTVERWEAGDNPAQLRWHKEDCPFPRGRPCGNVAIASLFGRIMGIDRSMAVTAPSAGEEVLEQRDPVTGAVTRTVRYPSDLPERVRQTGGTFEIGPNNTINIQSGPGPTRSQVLAAPRSTPRAQVQPSQPRQWRMANVISADVRRFLTNLFLTRELDRLTSFARWPTQRPNASPVALAKSGFFYLGDADRTQCFSCGGVLRNWTAEDNPDTEHQRHFPQCLFLFGDDRRNVSIPLQPESRDEREQLYPCTFPTNPHMRSEATRLETFDSRWPMGRTAATPEQIAEAGFFFLGERDRVKCWYCNGGLQHWEYDDIPWVEHAKWFPNCQFLLRSKGQLYVYRYLAIHPHLARPIIARQAGARVDPGAGQDVPPPEDIPANAVNVRQPTPPPMIIDPQEDLRKRLEQVDRVMRTSDTVKTVLTMGFNEATVRAVLREKVESSAEENLGNAYSSVADLLDDVMAKDEEIKQEEQNRSNAASASSAGASMAAQPSVSGHGSGSFKTAPGSGKYNTSYINEDEEEDERNLYGVEPMEASSSSNSLTVAKETGGSKSLQEALNAIQEEKLCKICYSNPADVIFLPCSHMICCMDCTHALRQCPICRARIEKAIKTYTS